MDYRLNVVTYWYLLESNKIAEQDISFVCVPLIGVVIDYNMVRCVLGNDHHYLKCTCSTGCNTLFTKEIAKTTLQLRIVLKKNSYMGNIYLI